MTYEESYTSIYAGDESRLTNDDESLTYYVEFRISEQPCGPQCLILRINRLDSRHLIESQSQTTHTRLHHWRFHPAYKYVIEFSSEQNRTPRAVHLNGTL